MTRTSVKEDRKPQESNDERLISIKDIARSAGVHHSTVSRALHKSPLVTNATAERIRQIAIDAGYTPSAVARSLAAQKTRTIGVVVTEMTDPFHHEIISGLDEVASAHGYSVIIATSQTDSEREMLVVRSFHERRVDAIVVMSSRVGVRYMSLLSERKIPIVLLNNQRRSEFVHSVGIDNVEAAFDAVRYLVELGHRRIAYLGNQLGMYSDSERFLGYRQALDESDIPFQSELVAYCAYDPEAAGKEIEKLLTSPNRPTAVFCYNDMLALGVMQSARKYVRIPQDFSVVGFDDLFFARFLEPPLTTVLQPKQEMGRLAMELVIQLLTGETERNIHVKGKLVVRGSTGRVASVKAKK
jgi:DNA-binding LacI/PurR family transcriptional regulator